MQQKINDIYKMDQEMVMESFYKSGMYFTVNEFKNSSE